MRKNIPNCCKDAFGEFRATDFYSAIMLNMELGMVGLEKYFDATTPGVRALWTYSQKILVGFSKFRTPSKLDYQFRSIFTSLILNNKTMIGFELAIFINCTTKKREMFHGKFIFNILVD